MLLNLALNIEESWLCKDSAGEWNKVELHWKVLDRKMLEKTLQVSNLISLPQMYSEMLLNRSKGPCDVFDPWVRWERGQVGI